MNPLRLGSNRFARDQRGQTLVLGAISLLCVAMVVFGVLNVSRSVHEKIRLQNHADSTAYSLAVQEARAFNYYAYSNRAIASTYVAMANMHAYMSEAAMMVDADSMMVIAMTNIMGQEFDECDCCIFGPCCFWHCIHAAEAGINAIAYGFEVLSGSIGNTIKLLDPPFVYSMKAAGAHLKAIRTSQTDMKSKLDSLVGSTGGISQLNTYDLGANNTHANGNTSSSLRSLNKKNLDNSYAPVDDNARKILTNVVNATRPAFTWDRSGLAVAILPNIILAPIVQHIENDCKIGSPSIQIIESPNVANFLAGGRTGLQEDGYGMMGGGLLCGLGGDVSTDSVGKKIHSFDWAQMTIEYEDGFDTEPLPMMSIAGPGELKTGDSGDHRADWILPALFNNPHIPGLHDEKGVGETNGDNFETAAFMEFAISDDPSVDYNQPSVFADATSDTRYNDFGQRGPWEFTSTGEVKIDNNGRTGDVQLSDKGTAHALSKALVYYHRIGDWQEPPNFWNPYWRAKLDSMTLDQAKKVIPMVDNGLSPVMNALGNTNDRAALNLRENSK
jgi:hypothetical protein